MLGVCEREGERDLKNVMGKGNSLDLLLFF